MSRPASHFTCRDGGILRSVKFSCLQYGLTRDKLLSSQKPSYCLTPYLYNLLNISWFILVVKVTYVPSLMTTWNILGVEVTYVPSLMSLSLIRQNTYIGFRVKKLDPYWCLFTLWVPETAGNDNRFIILKNCFCCLPSIDLCLFDNVSDVFMR